MRLKTAITSVSSSRTNLHASILHNEGAQRSFITTDISNKLELVPTGKEALSILGFGDTSSSMGELPIAAVYLQTETVTFPIDVLIVPEIVVPLRTYPNKNKRYEAIDILRLVHPTIHNGYSGIIVVIEADYYWGIVQDRVVRGNGHTVVESEIGCILSGPTPGCTKKLHPTSTMNIMTSDFVEEIDLEVFWKVESLGID